ncbi:DUF188 domain-containing protein [Dielma fastidiosa]|uniref:Uncharacterized protein n=1 Tax=Dielma fastidiosa TaxID=1034346 RepID=A0A318KR17_9FIRM|nr:DUF188 domain-containing protein [Dielma fastidiosa]PXX78145.1 hypothetical protein DES51_10872 [Dielma fastidiosa]
MRLFIDGDGCPVIDECLWITQQRDIPVTLVCDTAHQYAIDGIEIIIVDQGHDHADFEILKRIRKGDLLVTQDTGLAALALGKGAVCLHPSGMEFDDGSILQLLNQRSDGIKIRKQTKRCGHIKKRSEADDERFIKALISCIERERK